MSGEEVKLRPLFTRRFSVHNGEIRKTQDAK